MKNEMKIEREKEMRINLKINKVWKIDKIDDDMVEL